MLECLIQLLSAFLLSNHLPNDHCALVYEDNFKYYFGPLSGRAFVMKNLTPPNISTSSRKLLLSVDGIGESIVNDIIESRKRQPFNGLAPNLTGKQLHVQNYETVNILPAFIGVSISQ